MLFSLCSNLFLRPCSLYTKTFFISQKFFLSQKSNSVTEMLFCHKSVILQHKCSYVTEVFLLYRSVLIWQECSTITEEASIIEVSFYERIDVIILSQKCSFVIKLFSATEELFYYRSIFCHRRILFTRRSLLLQSRKHSSIIEVLCHSCNPLEQGSILLL